MLNEDLGPVVASYLRAEYPFLALLSSEEERVLELLSVVSQDVARPVIPLSVTALQHDDPDATARSCLALIAEQLDPAVFVLLDFDPWLAGPASDPLTVRALRDLRAQLEQRRQTVVFLSPSLTVPPTLESDVIVLDVPLPDPGELSALLDREASDAGLSIDAEVRQCAIRSVQGLTALAARRAFRRAARDPGGLPVREVGALVEEKRRLLRRTDLLELIDTPPALADVGGLDALKAWLTEREAAFGDAARRFGLPTPKGILLVGVQGCGKSLTAKAIAHLWRLPLARLDFAALFSYAASPEDNLRRVMRLSDALAPVVLWIDEIDKAFQAVASDHAGSEVLHRLFGSFVTWLQEKQSPVFVAATANAVDKLPAELLRKGRFDEIFFVDLPSLDERAQILAIHLRAHGRDPVQFDVRALAGEAEQMSGSELEQVVIGGLYRAFRGGRELTDDDMRVAARGIVPLYRTAEDQIKALREWAEHRARRASIDAHLAEFWQR